MIPKISLCSCTIIFKWFENLLQLYFVLDQNIIITGKGDIEQEHLRVNTGSFSIWLPGL